MASLLGQKLDQNGVRIAASTLKLPGRPLEWLLERTWRPPEPKTSSPGRLLGDLKEPQAQFSAATGSTETGPAEGASPLPVLLLAK